MSTSTATSPRFIFFGGKGGVGKTTCAAACAVRAATAGRRVLVVSTDPAHSLGDALGVRLSARVRPVPIAAARGALDAVELDAPRAFARWLDANRQSLGDILEHGTWLDRTDINELLALSMPGVDELVGLIEIDRLADGRASRSAYDAIVVDTAPTGHTLRLLAAPETVRAVAGVLDALQQDHRIVRQQLARVERPESADRLIALIADEAREIGARLQDPQHAAFHWVLLPEELSVAESEDGVAALARARIPIADLIVNRVAPDDGLPCPICDRRRADEHRVIQEIARRLGRERSIRVAFAETREPRGIRALARFGRALFGSGGEIDRALASTPRRIARSGRKGIAHSSARRTGDAPETIRALSGARLLFFAGKGGVGKTTCAAATALRIARANPVVDVLLLSTDPAHSLADVLDVPIGHAGRASDAARSVSGAPPNLRVRELDAASALVARHASLERALDEIGAALGAAGGKSASELLDLAPPGIDELFAMLSVAELTAAAESSSIVVVDTAPTGHALRLLEMPGAAREWTRVLMSVLLKYRSLVPAGSLGAELVALSKSVRQLEQALHDRARSRFIVVTRATAVTRAETRRLLARLGRMKLPIAAVVMNALTLAPGRCPRCRATASAEKDERRVMERTCRRLRCAMILSPDAAPPPRGAAALEEWSGLWQLGLQA